MTHARAILLLIGAGATIARPALAQCPDGTPPPCVRIARRAPPSAAERGRSFLVLPFRNVTRSQNQEWLVEGATTMLADALGRWREIVVVSDERLYPALRRAGLQPGTVMDPVRVRRVAEETSGWTAVTGEVIATGGRVRVSARAYDVVTNRNLVRASDDVPAGGDVRRAFERIGARLLATAGLDTATVDLGGATTRSLDAYRDYLRGVAFARRSEYRRARDPLLDAVRLDSTFAQAWFLLAQATLFTAPYSAMFDAGSPFALYVSRATALAQRLPPRDRDLITAVGALFAGRISEARTTLGRLVAADSTDVGALSWLSMVEYVDPILVSVAGRETRRGSLDHQVRLLRRVLELTPENHGAYFPLVTVYLLAAGDLPGIMLGHRREAPSLRALFLAVPARVFVPLLRDTIEAVPTESLTVMPAESLAAARNRALDSARAWVGRWLAVGPTEGEAHRFAAKVYELDGQYERALREVQAAESLGVEMGLENIDNRRLALLGKLGRYPDAFEVAAAAWSGGRFDGVTPLPTDQLEALAWTFNLALMYGRFAHADSALDRLAASMRRTLGMDSAFSEQVALRLLAGSPVLPIWLIELPARFRVDVMDSLWARRDRIPDGSRVGRGLEALALLASRAASRDSTLAARVRAAPWYRPPQ